MKKIRIIDCMCSCCGKPSYGFEDEKRGEPLKCWSCFYEDLIKNISTTGKEIEEENNET